MWRNDARITAAKSTDATYHPVWQYKVASVHLAAAAVAIQG
jgi:hypothetical protein